MFTLCKTLVLYYNYVKNNRLYNMKKKYIILIIIVSIMFITYNISTSYSKDQPLTFEKEYKVPIKPEKKDEKKSDIKHGFSFKFGGLFPLNDPTGYRPGIIISYIIEPEYIRPFFFRIDAGYYNKAIIGKQQEYYDLDAVFNVGYGYWINPFLRWNTFIGIGLTKRFYSTTVDELKKLEEASTEERIYKDSFYYLSQVGSTLTWQMNANHSIEAGATLRMLKYNDKIIYDIFPNFSYSFYFDFLGIGTKEHASEYWWNM